MDKDIYSLFCDPVTINVFISDEIENAATTASFIMEVENVFDSLNGRTKGLEIGKILKTRITQISKHLSFWKEAKKSIDNLKILNHPNRINSHNPQIITINGVEHVWQKVQTLNRIHWKIYLAC
jgi:hypothetical protein